MWMRRILASFLLLGLRTCCRLVSSHHHRDTARGETLCSLPAAILIDMPKNQWMPSNPPTNAAAAAAAGDGENVDPQLPHARADGPPPLLPKSSILASGMISPPLALKRLKALRRRMTRNVARRGGVAPPPSSSGGDGRDGDEDDEAGSMTSEGAGGEIVEGHRTERDDELLIEDDVDEGVAEAKDDSIHRRSSFHLAEVGSRSIPAPSPPDAGRGGETADDASVDSAMRRIGAECAARAAPLDAILAEIAGPILDEAHRLLSVTATNSIDELEGMLSPATMIGGIPGVLFARDDDWEERVDHVVAASSLSPATAETTRVGASGDERGGRRNDAVDGDGIGIGWRISPIVAPILPRVYIVPPDECETADAGQMVGSDDAADELESCIHAEKERSRIGISAGDDGGASRLSGECVAPSTESFFDESLLNEEVKKAKGSPKSRKNPPEYGVVRSRVSNIQKRVEFSSSSSDEGGSQQTYTHPRVCVTSPHRSIPIGIAKTYNKKNLRSTTSGTNIVRTSSKF